MASPTDPIPPRLAAHFAGGGEMGARMLAIDWSETPLGPIATWPQALLNAVSLMLPAAAEIVLFWGADYVALYNDAYAPTIGDKHPRALGCPARECWSELWDDLEPLLSHVRTTGETYSAKDRPFRMERHGYVEEVYFDISYSAVRAEDGSVGGVLCIVSETTERVRATRAIAEDRARLSEMFDQGPSFMAMLRSPGYVFELANASYMQLVGRTGSLIGMTLAEAIPEVVDQGFITILDRVVERGEPYRDTDVRVELQSRPGGAIEPRYVDFVFQPIRDAEGQVTGVFVEGFDVTGRHKAERALDATRESMALATEAAEIGTWDLDVRTDRLFWSEGTYRAFGLAAGAPVSIARFLAAVHEDDRDRVAEAFARTIDPAIRAVYDQDYRAIGIDDGVVRWIAARGRAAFEGDQCIRAIGTVIDITERKRLDAEVAESEARFRSLADTVPALIWMTDSEGRLIFANRGFEDLLDHDAETVRTLGLDIVIPPRDRARVAALRQVHFAERTPWGADMRVIAGDGAIRWIHAEGRPRLLAGAFAGFVGCAVDVTDAHLAAEALERRIDERTRELAAANRALTEQIAEREQVEATLSQMQRLEAVGQLTSGVAHDFNNLLTVVLGNVGMIARSAQQAGLDERTMRRLDHVRTAAERGATLTAQLLAFSRRQRLEARPIDLNATMAGMRDLLQSSLGGTVTVETDLADGLWPGLVDPTQIELIILNLAINARDAMEGGGTLTVATANATMGEPGRAQDPPAGDHVVVAVRDTGSGMTDAVLARAFEPFFTTKPVGKGSGLGLAQVYGFAKQSGGGVTIETAPGQGTTVRVYLPRAGDAAPVAVAEDRTSGDIAGRTIVVLDDDDAVRGVTADHLRERGCRVIEAADGAAALDALAAERGIDLVVADFAMPGMNGVEFAQAARGRRPGLPVLFVTGFAELSAIADVPEGAVLQKPYREEDLARRIRAMLG